ncbi:unnamed protein product [Boreogadus saida]
MRVLESFAPEAVLNSLPVALLFSGDAWSEPPLLDALGPLVAEAALCGGLTLTGRVSVLLHRRQTVQELGAAACRAF